MTDNQPTPLDLEPIKERLAMMDASHGYYTDSYYTDVRSLIREVERLRAENAQLAKAFDQVQEALKKCQEK